MSRSPAFAFRIAVVSAIAALTGSMIGGFSSFKATQMQTDATNSLLRKNDLATHCTTVQTHARSIDYIVETLDAFIRDSLALGVSAHVDTEAALRSDEVDFLQSAAALRLVSPKQVSEATGTLIAKHDEMMWYLEGGDDPHQQAMRTINLIGEPSRAQLEAARERFVEAGAARTAFRQAWEHLREACRTALD